MALIGRVITLTVRHKGQRYQQSFEKDQVVIGAGPSSTVDIPLKISGLKNEHVVIDIRNGRHVVDNVTHDDRVTLNGLAFGSRSIKVGDELSIAGATLYIDEIRETGRIEIEESQQEKKPAKMSKQEKIKAEELLSQVNRLTKQPDASERNSSIPFKDFEIPEYKQTKWKWPQLIGLFLLLIALCGGFFTYYSVATEDVQKDRFEAAVAVSDVGMALLYAQMHHVRAPHDNWSNRTFIDRQLPHVIGSQDSPYYRISPERMLPSGRYLLRVITNQDLSQFVVIAQPSGRYSEWFNPKSAFILDSSTMELKKTANIRELNRLLVNPYALEERDDNQLLTLIRQAEPVTLKSLSGQQNPLELQPPKGLGFIRPGAEKYVYNAPRYYKFTEKFVTIASERDPQNLGEEEHTFRENFKRLTKLNDLIFYTTLGIDTAVHAYETLNMLFPQEEYLVGSITLDPATEDVTSNLLLTMKGAPKQKDPEIIAKNPEPVEQEPATRSIDVQSVWFNDMITLRVERTKELEPIAEAISVLLLQNSQQVDPNFKSRLNALLTSYYEQSDKEETKIAEALDSMYQEYRSEHPNRPKTGFIKLVKMTGLEQFINGKLYNDIEQDDIDRLGYEQASYYFDRVKNSDDLRALSHNVEVAIEYIDQSDISPGLKKESFQSLRKDTLMRLGFLLNGKISKGVRILKVEDRNALDEILQPSIVSEKERQNYLNKFDKKFSVE